MWSSNVTCSYTCSRVFNGINRKCSSWLHANTCPPCSTKMWCKGLTSLQQESLIYGSSQAVASTNEGEGTTHQGQSLDKCLCEIKVCLLYHHMCHIAGIEIAKTCYIQPMFFIPYASELFLPGALKCLLRTKLTKCESWEIRTRSSD